MIEVFTMATNNEIEFKQILTKDLYDKINTYFKMKNHLAKLIIILIL